MKHLRKELAGLAVMVCLCMMLAGCGRNDNNTKDTNRTSETTNVKDNETNAVQKKETGNTMSERNDNNNTVDNNGTRNTEGALGEVGEGIGEVGDGIVNGVEDMVDDVTDPERNNVETNRGADNVNNNSAVNP